MVMRSIAIGLLLDERFFDKYVDQQCHNLRLLSYPPISRSLLDGEGRTRAGAHSGGCRIVVHVVLIADPSDRLWHDHFTVPGFGRCRYERLMC